MNSGGLAKKKTRMHEFEEHLTAKEFLLPKNELKCGNTHQGEVLQKTQSSS
jgi:hypothetical protein